MQHELNVDFGQQIQLVGYDLGHNQADSIIDITLYWQAKERPKDNYNVFIHVTPLDNLVPIAQVDGLPLNYDRPTLSWDDPTETLVSRKFEIHLPPNGNMGQYRILVGLYNYVTGQRLRVGDKDYLQLEITGF